MKIFLSWSGKVSCNAAEILSKWLPAAIQYVKPYFSHETSKGTLWAHEVASELASASFGLICVTQENMNSPWLMFESGALGRGLQEFRVIPILVDIEPSDLTGPLAQFQVVRLEKDDVYRMLRTINSTQADNKLSEMVLETTFNAMWPNFETEMSKACALKNGTINKDTRSEREILAEILDLSRNFQLRTQTITQLNQLNERGLESVITLYLQVRGFYFEKVIGDALDSVKGKLSKIDYISISEEFRNVEMSILNWLAPFFYAKIGSVRDYIALPRPASMLETFIETFIQHSQGVSDAYQLKALIRYLHRSESNRIREEFHSLQKESAPDQAAINVHSR